MTFGLSGQQFLADTLLLCTLLMLLHPACVGWANTNIYICKQGCGSEFAFQPLPVVLLASGKQLQCQGWETAFVGWKEPQERVCG